MQIVKQPVKTKKDMNGAVAKMWVSGVKFDFMATDRSWQIAWQQSTAV